MHARRQVGIPVTIAAVSDVKNTTPFVYNPGEEDNTWRRGQHVQMIKRVIFNRSNVAIGMELYNPYRSSITITDLSRIYFCMKPAGAIPSKR